MFRCIFRKKLLSHDGFATIERIEELPFVPLAGMKIVFQTAMPMNGSEFIVDATETIEEAIWVHAYHCFHVKLSHNALAEIDCDSQIRNLLEIDLAMGWRSLDVRKGMHHLVRAYYKRSSESANVNEEQPEQTEQNG